MTDKNAKATVKKEKKTALQTTTKSKKMKKDKEEQGTIKKSSSLTEEIEKQPTTKRKAATPKTKKKGMGAPKKTSKKKSSSSDKPTAATTKTTKNKASQHKSKKAASTSNNKKEKSSYIDISSGIKDKDREAFKLTKRGLEILKSELKELKTVKRAEISERIRQARALGDLSENSEYEDAKREQAVVEIRVSELENMLRKSIIVDEDLNDDNGETVRMGHSVVIESIESKEQKTFKIVSVLEADPFTNAVSNVSPLGSALIGHQVGNVIRVVLPIGAVRYRLVEICKKES